MSLSRDNENLLRQEKRGGKEKEEEKKTNKGRIKEIKKPVDQEKQLIERKNTLHHWHHHRFYH